MHLELRVQGAARADALCRLCGEEPAAEQAVVGGEKSCATIQCDMLDPAVHSKFLGQTFITRLNEPALIIGKDAWTRHQLADELRVANFKAAALVTRAMRELKVKNLEEVFSWDPTSLAVVHNLGETGMYVLLRALEAKGHNPKAWYGANKKDLVTFRTLKIREQKKKEAEKKAKRKRR